MVSPLLVVAAGGAAGPSRYIATRITVIENAIEQDEADGWRQE
jgi:hypothetical protein